MRGQSSTNADLAVSFPPALTAQILEPSFHPSLFHRRQNAKLRSWRCGWMLQMVVQPAEIGVFYDGMRSESQRHKSLLRLLLACLQ